MSTHEIVAEAPRGMTIPVIEASGQSPSHDEIARIISDHIVAEMKAEEGAILGGYGWAVHGILRWVFDYFTAIVHRSAPGALVKTIDKFGAMSGDEIVSLVTSAKQRSGVISPPGTKESG